MASFLKYMGKSFSDEDIIQCINKYAAVMQVPVTYKTTVKELKRQAKRTSKEGDSDDDDGKKDTSNGSSYITYDVPHDPSKQDSPTYKLKLYKFKGGNAEHFLYYRRQMIEFFAKAGMEKKPSFLHTMTEATLVGPANKRYVSCYNNVMGRDKFKRHFKGNDKLYLEALSIVFNEFTKSYFTNWETAYAVQKRYMRQAIYMGKQNPQVVKERLIEMNDDLPLYPYDMESGKQPTKLPEDELIDILDGGKRPEWHLRMLKNGHQPTDFQTIDDVAEFYERMYVADKLQAESKKASKAAVKPKHQHTGKRKSGGNGKQHAGISSSNQSGQQPWKKHKSSSNQKTPWKQRQQQQVDKQVAHAMQKFMSMHFQADKKETKTTGKRKAKQAEDAFLVNLSEKMSQTSVSSGDESGSEASAASSSSESNQSTSSNSSLSSNSSNSSN